jgi:hypothetical protein
LDHSEPSDVLPAIHVEDGLVQDGILERLDHSQPDIGLTSMLTQAPPLLLLIDAPILPTPQTRKRRFIYSYLLCFAKEENEKKNFMKGVRHRGGTVVFGMHLGNLICIRPYGSTGDSKLT